MAENGVVKEEEVPVDLGLVATQADFLELLKANPRMQLPLVTIIQQRLLAEKDAEIAELKQGAKESEE